MLRQAILGVSGVVEYYDGLTYYGSRSHSRV